MAMEMRSRTPDRAGELELGSMLLWAERNPLIEADIDEIDVVRIGWARHPLGQVVKASQYRMGCSGSLDDCDGHRTDGSIDDVSMENSRRYLGREVDGAVRTVPSTMNALVSRSERRDQIGNYSRWVSCLSDSTG